MWIAETEVPGATGQYRRGGFQRPLVERVRHDAEHDHREGRDAQRERKQARWDEHGRAGVGVVHVHVHDDAQVVERREHRVEREDHGEPGIARVEHRLDHDELRDEPDRRRDAGERDEEDREHERAERLAP
jgi:hypothetical protein